MIGCLDGTEKFPIYDRTQMEIVPNNVVMLKRASYFDMFLVSYAIFLPIVELPPHLSYTYFALDKEGWI